MLKIGGVTIPPRPTDFVRLETDLRLSPISGRQSYQL